MNRITTLLAVTALFHLSISAQNIQPAATSFNPNQPHCAFDEMNHLLGLEYPKLEQERLHFLNEVVPKLSSDDGKESGMVEPLLTISVVVHVIHSGEPVGQGQNISDAQIKAQIAILNQDYTSLNPQFYNTPAQWTGIAGTPNIQFCLASFDPSGNPANGITRHNMQVTGTTWSNNNINSTIKPATKWNPLKYMNIYVLPIPGTTAAGGVVGFANYPTPSLIGADQDGIVIDYRWFGAPGYGVSGWRPITHETGHYLGLPHPFQGNSCSSDDGIADTPNMDKSTREYVTMDCANGYPMGPVSCGNEHLFVNYMDYVTENCYTSFTNGQVNVIRGVLNGTSQGFNYGSRNQLITSAPAQCNIPANDAGITRVIAPATTTCTSNTLQPVVTLRNFGTNNLTSVNIITKVNTAIAGTMTWTGNLIPGENKDVTLPGFTPPNGNYNLTFYTLSPNSQTDQRTSNDTVTVARFTYVAITPPMLEDFEGETGFPTNEGIFSFNVSNDDFEWVLTGAASGFGQGSKSAMFDNYAGNANNNPFGTVDALITRHFDFTNITQPQIKFDVAYAPFSSFVTDTLLVLVATNCTQLFDQLIYEKGGFQLATAPATAQIFVPTSTQWRTETIDLTAYQGMSDVTIAFLNVSGWGNRVYVDNIKMGKACSTLSSTWTNTPAMCDDTPPFYLCTAKTTINVAGGNGSFTYKWNGSNTPTTQNTLNNLCPNGTVTVTVTDALGCTLTAQTQTQLATPPTVNLSSTQATGYNTNDGTITVNFSTIAPPPYNIFVYGPTPSNQVVNQSPFTISNLAPGIYSIDVEDTYWCPTSTAIVVGSACDAVSLSTSGANVSCFGGSNGSLTATPSNGTGPYTYAWSNGPTTFQNQNLPAGNYTVTVTDSKNCPATNTATVSQPAQLVLNVSVTHETANNAKNGTASVGTTGGTPNYTYLWSNGATTAAIFNLAPGTYNVTVTDAAGCTKTNSVTVNTFSCGSFQTGITSTNITCNGLNNGTASVSVTGGAAPVTFNWSNGQTTQMINNLAPGPYAVTVSDAVSCTAIHSVSITQPVVLLPNVTATGVTSNGANDGMATASPTGGTMPYQFTWNNGATTAAISSLAPGNYILTVTDNKGCTASQTVTVQGDNCTMTIDLDSQPTACPNVPQGSAEVTSVSGGAGPITYLWSNGSTSFFINGLVAGNYSVTVTAGNGCTVTGSVMVGSSDNQPPVAVAVNTTVYLGPAGVAIPNPEAIGSGSFDNCNLVNLSISPTAFACSQIGNNSVTLTVTDAAGNTATANLIVTVLDELPPVITCPNNITSFNCTAITYTTPVAVDNCSIPLVTHISGPASGEAFPAGVTTVTWKATDAGGFSSTCSFTVSVNNTIAITIHNVIPATNGQANGEIQIILSGGTPPYSFVWLQNGTVIPGFDPAHASPGIYQLQVTDSQGCMLLSDNITVDNTTGTVHTEMERRVLVFPNPSGGLVNLFFDLSNITRAEVTAYDVTGRTLFFVKKELPSNQIFELDFSDYSSGVYWLKIGIGGEFIMKKVVKL